MASPSTPPAAEPPPSEEATLPRLADELAARLAVWEVAAEQRRAREGRRAAPVLAGAAVGAGPGAGASRSAHRRLPGGQKSCSSMSTCARKHHSMEDMRPDLTRAPAPGLAEGFRFRHSASPEELLRDYRRLVTYPRQRAVLRAPLVLRSRPSASDHQVQPGVASRHRQAAEALGNNQKANIIIVSTAPAVADFRSLPKEDGGAPSRPTQRLPPPRWDRWLEKRQSQDRSGPPASTVHLPPLPEDRARQSRWAVIGASDSWTSFTLETPAPAPPPGFRPPVLPPVPRPPPSTRAPAFSTRPDLEGCLSVAPLQPPEPAPISASRHRLLPPPLPPPRPFELVRNPADCLTVTPVQPPWSPASKRVSQPTTPPPSPPGLSPRWRSSVAGGHVASQ